MSFETICSFMSGRRIEEVKVPDLPSFGALHEQTKIGQEEMSQMRQFTSKLSAIHLKCSREITNLVLKEQENLKKRLPDRMESCRDAWTSFLFHGKVLADLYHEVASNIKDQVVFSLETSEITSKKVLDNVLKEYSRLQDIAGNAHGRVDKSKVKCMKAFKAMDIELTVAPEPPVEAFQKFPKLRRMYAKEDEKTVQERSDVLTRLGRSASVSKILTSLGVKETEDQMSPAEKRKGLKKLLDVCTIHKAVLEKSNRELKDLERMKLRRILERLEEIEKSRHATLQEQYEVLSKCFMKLSAELSETCKSIKRESDLVDHEKDMKAFKLESMENSSLYPSQIKFQLNYDLPLTVDALKKRILDIDKLTYRESVDTIPDVPSKNSSSSQQQRSKAGLDERFGVLSWLLCALYTGKCYEKEGIFRVSGKIKSISKIHSACNDGSYFGWNVLEALEESDVFTIGDTLKLYFRKTNNALIPGELYQEAVKAGNSHIQEFGPDASMYLDDSSFRQLQSLMERIPRENRELIRHFSWLMFFCHDPSGNGTKMELSSLALVFSSCIVRNPQDDPVVQMRNINGEARFVHLLVLFFLKLCPPSTVAEHQNELEHLLSKANPMHWRKG